MKGLTWQARLDHRRRRRESAPRPPSGLLEEGARVYVFDRDEAACQRLKKDTAGFGWVYPCGCSRP
ncbi:MAG: hypothetical protein MZV64_33505 [Ignavibacteriales bacterium]|nr:hypothetical protein [Ignavibacteriales bacterium]